MKRKQKTDLDTSKWALLYRLMEAKRLYYIKGKSDLTDQEYDALENTIEIIHGVRTLEEWVCVGFDGELYDFIKRKYIKAIHKLKKEYNQTTITKNQTNKIKNRSIKC